MSAARSRAVDAGISCPGRSAAAALELVAAATSSSAVVEVGTGTGVTGSSLLAGMRKGGVLTSIDSDAGRQRTAKDALGLAADGVQVRLIRGAPAEVLPRLADAAYDLIVVNDSEDHAEAYFEQALRLLRAGGAVVFTDATAGGKTFDATVDTPQTRGLRAMLERAKDRELVHVALLPVDGGLLIGVKR